jgi:hypothetical protein
MHSTRKGIRFATKLAFRLFDKSEPVVAVSSEGEQKGMVIFGDFNQTAAKRKMKSPAIRKRSPRKSPKKAK